MKMHMKLIYFFLLAPVVVHTSPVSVTDGGTDLVTMNAAGGMLYSTSAIAIAVVAIGASTNALTVSGGNPVWSAAPAALPGYIAATSFAYAGSTSTITTSASANRSMIISTTAPTTMTSSAVDNTVVGYYALNSVTSGTGNTAIGSQALLKATGSGNTAVGYQALVTATSGAPNTALGTGALDLNLTGTNNTGIGYHSMFQILGSFNTSMGANSLGNATGSKNTAAGRTALGTTAVSAGDSNTAIGYNISGASTILGSNNVAIGSQALTSNTASNTTGVGFHALAANTGNFNTGVGYQALNLNNAGANNTGVGYQALLNCVSGLRNTAVGSSALSNTSNSDSTACGYQALLSVAGGSSMTGLGSGAGSTATTGSNNIYIGYDALPISVIESNNIVIGNFSNLTCYIYGINGVNVGASNTVIINGSSLLGAPASSKIFKKNIVEVPKEVFKKFLDLNVVKFTYIGDQTQEIYYGMIAEDVHEIMPEIVVRDINNEIYAVQYDKLIALLIQHLQMQNNDLKDLKVNVQTLKEAIQNVLDT